MKVMMVILMNRKKIIFVVFICLLLCCGCDVKYSLQIDKVVNEEIDFSNYVINYSDELYFSPFEMISQQYSYSGFAASESNYILDNHYDNIESYTYESALSSLFSNNDYIQINGKNVKIDIDLYNVINEIELSYGNINNLEVSLYIPYYVSNHNADSVKDNTYTWVIDDLENDTIKINFDMSKPANFIQKIISYSIIGIIVIGVICVIIYFVGKNKKANEI